MTVEPDALDNDLVEDIRMLKETREQIAAMKKAEEGLREKILETLDRRQSVTFKDEVSGLRVTINKQSRYEWDAEALRQTGELRDSEIGDLMDTVISKKRMQVLIDNGTVTERRVLPAKRITKTYEVLSLTEENHHELRR